MNRARRAPSERTVTIRPAPDAMTYVTGLLPVAQGVAVHAALTREADSLRALLAGDEPAHLIGYGHDASGATAEHNLQGLCERCNHAKQAPRWRARPTPGPRHTVVVTTPTGHRHTSTAPPPPSTHETHRDLRFTQLLLSA